MVIIPLWQLQEGRDRGWNGQKETEQDDKWSVWATEGQRVMAIKRQQASVGSTLMTPLPPLLLNGGDGPRRTSDEVKTGQNSVPPSCLFRLALKYFMLTPLMLWQKALVIPRMETSSWAAAIHVKSLILFIAHLAGGNGAAYFSQHAVFLHFCSIENILDPI